MTKLPIGLQLYTVREDAAKDFSGTIKKIAGIGYNGVELAGYGGLSLMALKTLMDDNNLMICGSHIGIDNFEHSIAQIIDDNLALNNKNVIIPYLSEERRQDAEGYRRTADQLNEYGELLNSHGLTLSYHNHAFEFDRLSNGDRGIDILLDNTNPLLVKAEVDTYWVVIAGEPPVEFIKRHQGRINNLHLKDHNPEDGSFAEVGMGDLPIGDIIKTASEIGVQWLIVEQDMCKRQPMDSIRISYNNLTRHSRNQMYLSKP